jgi:hypothetical protein
VGAGGRANRESGIFLMGITATTPSPHLAKVRKHFASVVSALPDPQVLSPPADNARQPWLTLTDAFTLSPVPSAADGQLDRRAPGRNRSDWLERQ